MGNLGTVVIIDKTNRESGYFLSGSGTLCLGLNYHRAWRVAWR